MPVFRVNIIRDNTCSLLDFVAVTINADPLRLPAPSSGSGERVKRWEHDRKEERINNLSGALMFDVRCSESPFRDLVYMKRIRCVQRVERVKATRLPIGMPLNTLLRLLLSAVAPAPSRIPQGL